MAQAAKQGKCNAPCVGWKTICDDLKRLILGKLSLYDHARATIVCRELREAYLSRAAEERAALIAAGEKAYGKRLVSGFVTALRRAMPGEANPNPFGLVSDSEGSHDSYAAGEDILITNADEPRRATTEEIQARRLADEPCAIVDASPPGYVPLFADLIHARAESGSGDSGVSQWTMCRRDDEFEELCLEVRVHSQAAAATLGILLAFRMETPEGLSACCGRPFTFTLIVKGKGEEQIGEMEFRDRIDGLVAPLCTLGENVWVWD